jgi:dethiobiotin synthetase
MRPIFITGIGTGVGKTLVAAILAEALKADYWKPVQAGYENGTDSTWIKEVMTNPLSKIHREAYLLKLAASPHIAGRAEGIQIDLDFIKDLGKQIQQSINPAASTRPAQGEEVSSRRPLIIEGAGGLLSPLNDNQMNLDLILQLDPVVVLVSRNYLGSINHSLLTAKICQMNRLRVAGWVFNDQYLNYEEEIVRWTGIPWMGSIPFTTKPDQRFVDIQARNILPFISSRLAFLEEGDK